MRYKNLCVLTLLIQMPVCFSVCQSMNGTVLCQTAKHVIRTLSLPCGLMVSTMTLSNFKGYFIYWKPPLGQHVKVYQLINSITTTEVRLLYTHCILNSIYLTSFTLIHKQLLLSQKWCNITRLQWTAAAIVVNQCGHQYNCTGVGRYVGPFHTYVAADDMWVSFREAWVRSEPALQAYQCN